MKKRTTLDLLNEVIEMGFGREYALESIDSALDDELGIENRKDMSEEFLKDDLYNAILCGFKDMIDSDGNIICARRRYL